MLEILDILVGVGASVNWAIVPSLGAISMRGLAAEKQYDDYSYTGSSVYTPISLLDLAETFVNFDGTNTNGVNYPDSSKPHAMSEWRGYDHDYGLSCSSLYSRTLGYEPFLANDPCSAIQTTYYTDQSFWQSSVQLYRNQGGGSCVPANAGYYYEDSNGGSNPVREWNGSTFVGNYGCP